MKEDLHKRIKIIYSLIDESLASMNEEISEIIKNKNKSRKTTKEIERTLDQLLDFVELGKGNDEFLKLNNHYKTINRKGHDFYRKEYEKMKKYQTP